ncbi:hypothetical protein LG943_01640 [Streptomonospora sp. S1-112]|uniref:RNA polymerase sigma factor n=1 Tax=Streptomonospora mangrovi TaxID=2883123 RepID=A0A9X3NJ07_9ACTN|nr:hypothetical protein [Streptomonospora mangrovi]MDA0563043.1 hypothetical protein [Streptomonospora mangrovi]
MTAHSIGDPAGDSAQRSAGRRAGGRHSAVPAAELALALRRGTGHDRCYDLLATRLYRYCWSLLGPAEDPGAPDPAAEAVHEAFLAATHHVHALADDDDLVPWLFALVRAAARRRGFCAESPYARLPVMPRERAVVELSQLLPPSRRELLELYLRHHVPTAHIARVAGLGPDTAADLCRTAVLHAADLLARHELAPAHTRGRGPDRAVREVLGLLEPPAPPRGLRERVLHDCASPLKGAERRAAADALAPVGTDGFPLHRDRTAGGGAEGAGADAEAAGLDGADDGARESAALPRDRVTTRDVPATAGAEAVAAPAPGADPARPRASARRRRPRALTATAAAVAVVLCLWGGVAAVRGFQTEAVTGARLPAPPGATTPGQEGAGGAADASAEPDTGPRPPASAAPVPAETVAPATPAAPPAEGAPPAADGGGAAEAPGAAGGAGQAPPSSGADAPEDGQDPEEDAGGGSEGGGDTGGPGGGGEGEGDGDSDGGSEPGRRGPLSELVGGLLGLLGGGGAAAEAE